MILAGCTFKNIPEVVVNVRSGYDQFARRGGLKYYKDVLKFNRWMYEKKLISLPRHLSIKKHYETNYERSYSSLKTLILIVFE